MKKNKILRTEVKRDAENNGDLQNKVFQILGLTIP